MLECWLCFGWFGWFVWYISHADSFFLVLLVGKTVLIEFFPGWVCCAKSKQAQRPTSKELERVLQLVCGWLVHYKGVLTLSHPQTYLTISVARFALFVSSGVCVLSSKMKRADSCDKTSAADQSLPISPVAFTQKSTFINMSCLRKTDA